MKSFIKGKNLTKIQRFMNIFLFCFLVGVCFISYVFYTLLHGWWRAVF